MKAIKVKYNLGMIKDRSENLFRVTDIIGRGKLPVPLPDGDVREIDYPEGQPVYIPNKGDEAEFVDFLKGCNLPAMIVNSSAIEGYEGEEQMVPLDVVMFPKNGHFAEQLRMDVVMVAYNGKHPQGDHDFKDIQEKLNSTSIGIGLFYLNNGRPECLATGDIKFGSNNDEECVYDRGGQGAMSEKHIRKFLERARAFVSANRVPLIIDGDISGLEIGQTISQIEDGSYLVDVGRVVIHKGGLPVNTLLRSGISVPDLEIGQLSSRKFQYAGAIIAASLVRLLEEGLRKNKDLKAGFSISPDLLAVLNILQNDAGISLVRDLMEEYEAPSFGDTREVLRLITRYARTMYVYPPEETKCSIIRHKNGKFNVVNGRFQGGSMESAGWYQGNDTNY